MKILKGSIISLAKQGYRTLQIPQYELNLDDKEYKLINYDEVPDDWILHIHSGQFNRLALSNREKKHSFWFLSRKGFEANKDAIKTAFENSSMKRGTWEQFLEDNEKFWKDVEKKTLAYQKTLKKKLKEVDNSIKNITI